MRPHDPQTVLKFYEQGMMTGMTLRIHLVNAVRLYPLQEFVDDIPVRILVMLRRESVNIPDPKEYYIVHGGTYIVPDSNDLEAERLAESRRYVDGLKVWQAYFADTAADCSG